MVIARKEKGEQEGWCFKTRPGFREVQITGLPVGSTFPILTIDPIIDLFLAYQL